LNSLCYGDLLDLEEKGEKRKNGTILVSRLDEKNGARGGGEKDILAEYPPCHLYPWCERRDEGEGGGGGEDREKQLKLIIKRDILPTNEKGKKRRKKWIELH